MMRTMVGNVVVLFALQRTGQLIACQSRSDTGQDSFGDGNILGGGIGQRAVEIP